MFGQLGSGPKPLGSFQQEHSIIEGDCDGKTLGIVEMLGTIEGEPDDGFALGSIEGANDGETLGASDGIALGTYEGDWLLGP